MSAAASSVDHPNTGHGLIPGGLLKVEISSRPIISKDNQMIASSINPLTPGPLPREREPVFPVNRKGITTVWLVGTAHPTFGEFAWRLLFVA